ncbi:MAG: 4Fe-4S binding protein [Treponemataceae bacterium]|nr:4Fe-4S binding protein [Treponemataceae bacterium]
MSKNAKIRLLLQAAFTALSNGYAKGFVHGKIYQGDLKYVCVPGLNCYSCPGALGSCPIGALQSTLTSREYNFSLYVFGLISLFGVVFGRFVCGFLCPFGLIQDLLFKIPFVKKVREVKGEKILRWFRFLILAVFVIILPMFVIDITGLGKPWFCKYICPVGTLEGGIPLVLMNENLRSAIGFLFEWKVALLTIILLLSIIVYRPFCRYICPLGAIYGVFNKISFVRYSVNESKCTKCGICQKNCKLNIKLYENPNSMDCIRCGECKEACPVKAINIKSFKSG